VCRMICKNDRMVSKKTLIARRKYGSARPYIRKTKSARHVLSRNVTAGIVFTSWSVLLDSRASTGDCTQ
jgi:hypothetical protein